MKRILFILLFPFGLSSQTPKLNFGVYPNNPNSPYTWSDMGHFYGSFGITVASSVFCYKKVFKETDNKRIFKSVTVGGGISLFCGLGLKEGVHDYWMKRGSATLNDGANDFLGTGSGMIVCIAVFDTREKKKLREKAKYNRYKFGGN